LPVRSNNDVMISPSHILGCLCASVGRHAAFVQWCAPHTGQAMTGQVARARAANTGPRTRPWLTAVMSKNTATTLQLLDFYFLLLLNDIQ
jgi:hypothetical protein